MKADQNGKGICKQCGKYLPIELFRKYRGNRQAYYNYCKTCEGINNRYKRLINDPEPTEAEQVEIKQIEKLYEALKARGLTVFGIYEEKTTKSDFQDIVSEMLEEHAQVVDEIPTELLALDKKDFSNMTEDELEDLQSDLTNRYCPITGYTPGPRGNIPTRDKSIYDKYDGIFGRVMQKIDEGLGY